MTDAWSEFVAAFHEHGTRDPNTCVALGVERRLGELPDPSLHDRDVRVETAGRLLEQARALQSTERDFDRTLDLEIAAMHLECSIHEDTLTFNDRTDAEQRPEAGHAIGAGLHDMLLNDPRPAGERLSDITSRIEHVPAYLDALLARLDHPVQRWVQIDCEEVAGLPDLFAVLRDWAEREQWPDRARLGRVTGTAGAALESYMRRLRAMPTVDGLHVGDAATRRLLALRGLDLTPEQLREIAADFLAVTLSRIEELRGTLADRYGLDPATDADGVQQFLNERFSVGQGNASVEQVLDRYRAERDNIQTFIESRDLFPMPAEQAMRIIQTPEFLTATIPAGAMSPPPAFRPGVRTSIVYLTLTDALIAEHNELTIPGMMIHEGIPGHHLQLAWAADNPSIVRRHLWAADLGEGWTTMLEDYMVDEGYCGDLADECRFCAKRGIARIGARVAIDLFFMTGDRGYLDVGVDCDVSDPDPFAAAGSLLAAVTGFPAARIEGELNWYSTERGYPLSYLAGNHLVWSLKRDAIEHARAAGEPVGHELDRRFHRVFLEAGNMPVRLLRRVMQTEGLVSAPPATA